MNASVSDMQRRIDVLLDEATGTGRIVGAVVIVASDAGVIYRRAAGLADREARKPMTEDAIFLLASVSKPMVATTALALIERGVLTMNDPITRWFPDFRPRTADGETPEITIRHLLTHTSGIGYSRPLPDDPYRLANVSNGIDQPGLSMAENLSRIASAPLYFAPGTAWRYGPGIDVLGAIIEAATGARLGEAVRQHVTLPLGMVDTGFTVEASERLVTHYGEGTPPNRIGEHYEIEGALGTGLRFAPRRIFNANSFHSGGGGMAGTAPDFIRLLEAIRRGGKPVLTAETVQQATTNQIGDLPREPGDAGWRFGFLSAVLDDPVAANTPLSRGALEWGGVYGHQWFTDPGRGVSVAAFTNTAVEGCLGQFPKDIRRAVIG